MKKFFILVFLCIYGIATAQVMTEAIAKEELAKRGISEERFRQEMQKRGVDLTKIDPTKPEELIKIESTVKEVIAMLENEGKSKGTSSSSTPPSAPSKANAQEVFNEKQKALIEKVATSEASIEASKNTKEIKKSVEKGASIEEAISENSSEQTKASSAGVTTFGQNLFRDNSLKLFRTSEDAKPSKSYILGAGDMIAISIFGISSYNSASEVTKDGYVQPEGTRLGRYYVAGLTIAEAEKLLKSGISRFAQFNDSEFKLTVATARTLTVNIFGEVFNNGSFNISAVNTAFNALVAAGGPTDLGSVRKIKLLRAGQKPRNIDVYKFINNPSTADEYYLQENDYIQVPLAEKLVTISGAVKRPFRYELLEEENLNDLLSYAGGLLPSAILNPMQVTRTERGKQIFIDVNLEDILSKKSSFLLRNGDVIKINESKILASNNVTIQGAIYDEGVFSFVPGMKISDILDKVKLREEAIKETAYLLRLNDDMVTVRYELINLGAILNDRNSSQNIELKKGDIISIRGLSDFIDRKKITVSGAVRKPGDYNLSDNKSLKISDVVFLSGGLNEKAAAFAYINRKIKGTDKSSEYIYVDVKNALENPQNIENLNLFPEDVITFYTSDEFIDEAFISIEGAVRKPNQQKFHPSVTLKEMILLGGGLTDIAATNSIEIYRTIFNDDKKTKIIAEKISLKGDENYDKAQSIKLMPNDVIIVRNAPEYETMKRVSVDGEIRYPGPYPLVKDNMRLSDLLITAGGLTDESFPQGATLFRSEDNTGFIIIDLLHASKKPGNYQDIILREGDMLTIPKQKNIVSIIGSTNYDELYPQRLAGSGKINVAHEPGRNAGYYVNNYAGGFDDDADRKRVTVEHRNGKIEKTKSFLFFRSYPSVREGSVITVPIKRIKPKDPEKLANNNDKDVDWSGVLKDSIAQSISVLSLILLLRSIN